MWCRSLGLLFSARDLPHCVGIHRVQGIDVIADNTSLRIHRVYILNTKAVADQETLNYCGVLQPSTGQDEMNSIVTRLEHLRHRI
jgi:hypothetical protein